MSDKAKKFEAQFKQGWVETIEDSLAYRLYDTTSGYVGIRNISDFVCYKYPNIFFVDCKTKKGNTLNFAEFSQYELMKEYIGIKGVKLGTMIWFYEKDIIVWVPIETWVKLKEEDKKSFNIKMIGDDNYPCFQIPTEKKRVFLKADYNALINYYKEKDNE